MTPPRPNRVISPHEMAHILSGIGELPHETVWDEVEAELVDAGYLPIEIEQIHTEWRKDQPPPPERTPITIDVSMFGDGSFTAIPNFDPGTIDRVGVNLEIRHEFIVGTGVTAISVSPDEADDITEAIRRATAQTRRMDPDEKEEPGHHEQLVEWLVEDGESSRFHVAVVEAFAKDAGAVRESVVAALVGIYESLKDVTIQEMMYDLTGDVLGLADDLELDRG